MDIEVREILDQLSDFEIENSLYTGYFVKAHDLLELIQESVQKFIELLPSGKEIQFMIEQDIWDDDYPRLILYAIVDLSVDEIIEYMHRFDSEFWHQKSDRRHHYMSTDTQFA